KAAHRYNGDNVAFDNQPKLLTQAVQVSMERLRTEFIDLLYIHCPDEATPKYDAIGALTELEDKGNVSASSAANFSAEELAEGTKDGYVDVVQDHHHLLEREAEQKLFPSIEEHGMSFVPYFPFASGMLAGKYTKDTTFAEGDLRLQKPDFRG